MIRANYVAITHYPIFPIHRRGLTATRVGYPTVLSYEIRETSRELSLSLSRGQHKIEEANSQLSTNTDLKTSSFRTCKPKKISHFSTSNVSSLCWERILNSTRATKRVQNRGTRLKSTPARREPNPLRVGHPSAVVSLSKMRALPRGLFSRVETRAHDAAVHAAARTLKRPCFRTASLRDKF